MDKFLKKLVLASDNEDYMAYHQIVLSNKKLIKDIESDYFREIFEGGKKKEIEFWIESEYRELTIHDLMLIPYKYDTLFHKGLDREDVSLEGVSDIVEMWKEEIEGEEDSIPCKKLINRIHAVISHNSFPKGEVIKFYKELLG
jgi:hypothetical protein